MNFPAAERTPVLGEAPPTLRAANLWPDRPALIMPSGPSEAEPAVWSFADLERGVCVAVAYLLGQGVKAGDVVGILGFNSLPWVVAHLALGRLGAVTLPLNARLAPPELCWQLERAEARLVLSDRPDLDLGPVPHRNLDAVLAGATALETESAADFGERESPDGLAIWDPRRHHTLLFTSGTTGRPKGVLLTWYQHLASAQALIEALGLDLDDRWLLCLPLFHVGGMAIVHRMLHSGGAVVLLPRFAPQPVRRAIVTCEPTRISLTATMARHLLVQGPLPARGLRTVLLGGEATGADLGIQAVSSYGLTEAGSTVALTEPGGSVLHALPGFEVEIRDERIFLRGPALMSGYLGRPPQEGGWLDTGDLGMATAEGGFVVLARREDLILSGGENVYPAEIEKVLLAHPGVQAAAVGGVVDDRWGQVPVAAVVTRGQALESLELQEYLRRHLASYKVPRLYIEVRELPTLASGKVDRRAVGALFHSPPRVTRE